MKKTIVDQTYNIQMAELTRRISRMEALLNGVPVTTAKIADAAITNAKIKDLTWDKAQGGTAVLGGVDNVDGVMSIHDGSDVEKVVLDKDGVLIKSGKLVIKNDGEVVSMDAKGIVSTANFTRSDVAVAGSGQTITLDQTDTDLTGITLTFTISRTSLVLFILTATTNLVETLPATNTGNAKILLKYGTSSYPCEIRHNSGTDQLETRTTHCVLSLGAGTYTFKAVGYLTKIAGNPYISIYDARLSYVIFGT